MLLIREKKEHWAVIYEQKAISFGSYLEQIFRPNVANIKVETCQDRNRNFE